MNTEDSEFERIEREAKLRQVPLPAKIYDYEEAYFALKAKRALAVPDAIHHTDTSETLEYIQGWNDCRAAMLAEQPAQQCKWPTCQSEEYQQALAEQIKRELVGEHPAVLAGYERHEYRPYGAPGEVRIHAILASQYKMPDGTIAEDFQWLADSYRDNKNTISLVPLYTAPQPAQQEPVYHLRQYGDVNKSQLEGMPEFLADLERSRTKYPKNGRMFDGLMGEIDELRRAYAGDGDVRAEAFDVAVCAYRIATEGDAGGNALLEPPEQPAQRKPLTDKEIWDAIRPLTKSDDVCAALIKVSIDEYRAIEAAHGIKEST